MRYSRLSTNNSYSSCLYPTFSPITSLCILRQCTPRAGDLQKGSKFRWWAVRSIALVLHRAYQKHGGNLGSRSLQQRPTSTTEQPQTKGRIKKAVVCLRSFSKISSSDILGFFFCFSVFRVKASGAAVLFSVGEMGDVATSRVGVTGSGSITDRVYTCTITGRFLTKPAFC